MPHQANTQQGQAVTETAACLLLLPDGRWVLQRRTLDAPRNAGKLGFFGGQLEPGETPQQAVVRELAEETDLDCTRLNFKLLGAIDLPDDGTGKRPLHMSLFETPIPSPDFACYEGAGIETYSLGEIRARDDLATTVIEVLATIYREQ